MGRVFRPGPEIRVPGWVPGREILPGRVSGLEFSNPGSGFHFEIFRVLGFLGYYGISRNAEKAEKAYNGDPLEMR